MSPARSIVIVGASLAGVNVAHSLREHGCRDRIVLVGGEAHWPYDRPPLSKTVLTGQMEPAATALREPDFYAQRDIELRLGQWVTAVDTARARLELQEGSPLAYDALVIATGARARRMRCLTRFDNVCELRTLDDALRVRHLLADSRRVAVVGGGFIGTEVAAAIRTSGRDVTLIDTQARLFGRVAGALFGARAARLHADSGVVLRLSSEIVDVVEGASGVEALLLSDGARVPVDLVVVGIGAAPCVEFLASSGLAIDDGVLCDASGSAAPGIHAVGDVARWQEEGGTYAPRGQHWTHALTQARLVAAHMMAAPAAHNGPHALMPYVWSDQHGSRFQFYGECGGQLRERFYEAADGRRFAAVYSLDGRVTGVAAFNAAAFFALSRALVAAGADVEAMDAHCVGHLGPCVNACATS
ncbi:NAD(P)/FAD-dependent oxidoreductase [Paraburkholderia sp.]|uniref:NAD(P)/FAD-dependent oxidoreductase n=1 Tax=Paraburkholderia sp. TaxID=1926495 RepID=UPI0039E64449